VQTRLLVFVSAALGLVLGLGGYTFIYARGASYLTDNPEACGNCHVMSEQLEAWRKSSHQAAAVCNDCHTPPGLAPKYATKVANGFWHSFAFTTGRFPDQIQVTPRNHEVAEQACRKCHAEIVDAIEGTHTARQTSCVRCHRSVGHLH
jgi:cytochrome c nitrite reductase small subunit